MYYSEEIIDEVASRNDIVDLINQYVPLQKKGANYMCCCPFHNEKTPSFSVSRSKQMYKCFGCGEAGGVFTFLQKYENMTFPEAVEYLAEKSGIKLPEKVESPKQQQIKSERSRMLEINKEAATYFYYCLRNPMGEVGYKYFKKRGLSDDTMNKWGLGFAAGDGRGLIEHLISRGYKNEELIKCGLASFSEQRGLNSKFWNRVMFPIFDKNGKVIGFGGRVMGDGEPKYLNSPETVLFEKSKNLYGLNFAKNSKKGYFILCEGYMDVIALHTAGFTEAMASLGTAFTMQHAGIIKRMVDKVYLCYDSDEAGMKAAIRAYDICREYDLSVKVINMKPYKDPDLFILNLGAEEFEKRIQNAENGFIFKAKYTESKYSISDPDERTKFYHELADMLLAIEDDAMRKNYIEACAEAFAIKRDDLFKWVGSRSMKNMPVVRHEAVIEPKAVKKENKNRRTQQLFLSYMADYPDIYIQVKEYVTADDFTEEDIIPIATRFLEDLSTGKANPSSLINMFEDPEDQANISRMFCDRIENVETNNDVLKVIKDVLIALKTQSYEYYNSKSGDDMEAIMKAIQGKKSLEKIKKINLYI